MKKNKMIWKLKESTPWKLIQWIHRQLNTLVFRVRALKLIAALLCAVLAGTVFHVHITYSDYYKQFNSLTTSVYLNAPVPRGVIYDRNMQPVVANSMINTITFRHFPNISINHLRNIATELAQLIEVEPELTQRDLRDLYVLENEEEMRALFEAEFSVSVRNNMTAGQVHQEMVNLVTEAQLATLTEEQKEIHTIFIRMNQGAGTTTNTIKEDPTDEEIARVTERLSDLPGIEIGSDWRREFPSPYGTSNLWGTLSTQQTGLPRERAAELMARGYAANARVGTSQLEWALEDYLAGFQSRYLVTEGVPQQVAAGMPGFQAVLTLDMELQKRLEQTVGDLMLEARRTRPETRYMNEAYVVLTNPWTGEVLAMVGIVLVEDENGRLEAVANPLGTFQSAFDVGSSVKGASLMAGYIYGKTSPGTQRRDGELRIQGSNPRSSWRDLGIVDDITAMSRSSNMFFWRQAMEFAGIADPNGGPIIGWPADGQSEAWDKIRGVFHQVGLGVSTGIELQNETTGMATSGGTFGQFLDFQIGQLDTYSAMQLAQYAGVMATRGQRMQMQVIRDIFMPGDEGKERQVVEAFSPNLLNKVELTDQQWDNLHQGLIYTVHGNDPWRTGANIGNSDLNYKIAGKTGTAEAFLRDENGFVTTNNPRHPEGLTDINNFSFVGFAPYNNPEVAISVIVPQGSLPELNAFNMGQALSREAISTYFALQRERANR